MRAAPSKSRKPSLGSSVAFVRSGCMDVHDDGGLTMTVPVRRVVSHIAAHLESPLRLDGLAAVSGLTARGLQTAFVREVGMSPMKYVQLLRLHAARVRLIEADHTDGATVYAIAQRFRFSNASRFAVAYAKLFGEAPSVTLRFRTARQ